MHHHSSMAATASSTSEAGKKLHVVMLPWLAFGHMIPFLELAKSMANKGVKVSYISTPKNIQRLPKIPQEFAHNIDFVGFPLPTNVVGLPHDCDCEATADIEKHEHQFLKKAYDELKHPFKAFVESAKPDWFILDFAPVWGYEIGRRMGIPCAFFSIYSALTVAFFSVPSNNGDQCYQRSTLEDYMTVPKWFNFPSTVRFRKFEARSMCNQLDQESASDYTDAARMKTSLEENQAFLIRSCHEFEGDYLQVVREVHRKPVLPTGFLPPQPLNNNIMADPKWENLFNWLDDQAPNSVVFVGFGSEFVLNLEDIHELALGLEESGLPFIWSLRRLPKGIAEQDVLPNGFLDRIKNRGWVRIGWSPQIKILSHRSIGSCLCHSGTSTVIESIQFGIPIVALPMLIDQGLLTRLIVERGIGIEVERDDETGKFKREDISKALKFAVVDEEGEAIRMKLKEMKKDFRDGWLQDRYVDETVEFLSSISYANANAALP